MGGTNISWLDIDVFHNREHSQRFLKVMQMLGQNILIMFMEHYQYLIYVLITLRENIRRFFSNLILETFLLLLLLLSPFRPFFSHNLDFFFQMEKKTLQTQNCKI